MCAQTPSRPTLRYLRRIACSTAGLQWPKRAFASLPHLKVEVSATASTTAPPGPPFPLDPDTVHTKHQEKTLFKKKAIHPIGSRRRRAVIALGYNVPFEQEPYQCFQEARKVLAADREEKLAQIVTMRRRIAKVQTTAAEQQGGQFSKTSRLREMQRHLEHLKILADINDPVIKKRFEDGAGDMDRPIYRYLADRKWRQYARKIIMQRIEQFHIVPDMLHHVNPTAAVALGFGRHNVAPGGFVDSRVSEKPARLNVQVYDKGERLVTVAVMDPDVPDLDNDSFTSRCHFLAINVPLSPTNPSIPLVHLDKEKQIVQPWLPAFAQKGSPYHRLSVFVLQQNNDGQPLDMAHFRQFQSKRHGWTVKKLMTNHQGLTPIGVNLFRTQWDEGTEGVMRRAGIPGAELQLVRKKPEKNIYKKKDGGRFR